MDSQVAVYDSQEKAISAIKALHKFDFPVKQISLVSKAVIIADDLHIVSNDSVKNAPMIVGMGVGAITGLLTGIGVFAIPGFGFLFGAGALIGLIAGFDVGLLGGGITSILVRLGINEDSTLKYEEHLEKGMTMIVVHGTIDEINKAEKILHTEGTHLEWGANEKISMNTAKL